MIQSRHPYLTALSLISASTLYSHAAIHSFESSTPPSWITGTQKNAISLSKYDAQHGKQSLLWDTAKSETLELSNQTPAIKAGTDIHQVRLWVYNEKPGGLIQIQAQGTGDDTGSTQSIDYQLNFSGWRSLWVHFGQDGIILKNGQKRTPSADKVLKIGAIQLKCLSKQKPKLLIDNLEVSDKAIPHGRLGSAQSPYIVNDASNRHNYPWTAKAYQYDPESFDTESFDLEELTKIEERIGNFIQGASFANRGKAKRGYLTVQEAVQIDAQGKAHGPGIYSHIVERYYNQNGAPGIHTNAINGALLYCADKFTETKDEIWKTRYLAYLDYRHRKGHAADSATMNLVFEAKNAENYVGSLILMKEHLGDERLMREAANIKWICGFNHLYSKTPSPVDADKILGDMQTLLISLYLEPALSKEDQIKKLCGYIQFGKLIDLTMVPGISNNKRAHIVKPDFGIWHHGMEMTFSYGYAAAQRYCIYHHALHGTVAELDSSVAEGIIAYYEGLFTMDGMGSYMGSRGLGTGAITGYASMLAHTAASGIESSKKILHSYIDAGTISPKSIPNHLSHTITSKAKTDSTALFRGSKTLPYAATIAHHLSTEHLAVIRGMNHSVASPEIFLKPVNAANVFGQQQGQGFLQLIPRAGIKTSAINMKNGAWDWSHYSGATTLKADNTFFRKHLNHAKTRADKSNFSGALSHFQTHGLFLQQLSASDKHLLKSLKGNKSWFFFGDSIVCLGSNLSVSTGTNHPLVTTLFQDNRGKKLSASPVIAFSSQGERKLEQPEYLENAPATTSALKDHDGHHYLMLDEHKIKLKKSEISSIDSTGKRDTKGPSSVAWIDHGVDPEDAHYAYAIQVSSTTSSSKHTLQDYSIVQRDNNAHIVTHNPSVSTGYAILKPSVKLSEGFIKSSKSPVLAMVSEVCDTSAKITICDPNLQMAPLDKHATEADAEAQGTKDRRSLHEIRVAGIWNQVNCDNAAELALKADHKSNTTLISLACIDGKNYDLTLSTETSTSNSLSTEATEKKAPYLLWALIAGLAAVLASTLFGKKK